MAARSVRWIAALGVGAVLASACSSSDNKTSATSASSGSGKLTATAKGVTSDSIKIGFSYPDLALLAKTGLLNIDNGPYEPIIKSIVDDVNKGGGINGRKLVLTTAPYNVLGTTAQVASCTKLTEDDKVFAVVGGFVGDNNLCVTQQHSTPLVSGYGSGFNQIALSKARAPWATWGASDEHAFTALVKLLDQQGKLKGQKIAVYAQQNNSKPLVDLAVKTLTDAGYKVADQAIVDVPASDTQAFNAQDKVLAQRFKDEGINTVFLVDSTPTLANWDSVGWHPSTYVPQTSLVTPAGIQYSDLFVKFPIVAGVAASGDPNAGYDTPIMQKCRAAYKRETGKEIQTATQEAAAGKSSGFTAMTQACSALAVFVAAATAAGTNLTPATWAKGLGSIGKIALPLSPIGSFGPNKPDAQDSFQLMKQDPTWTSKSSKQEFIALGQPITLNS